MGVHFIPVFKTISFLSTHCADAFYDCTSMYTLIHSYTYTYFICKPLVHRMSRWCNIS